MGVSVLLCVGGGRHLVCENPLAAIHTSTVSVYSVGGRRQWATITCKLFNSVATLRHEPNL